MGKRMDSRTSMPELQIPNSSLTSVPPQKKKKKKGERKKEREKAKRKRKIKKILTNI